jgi:hypothetical protein
MGSSHLSVGVSVEPRNLQLRIGPLRSGGADELFDKTDDLAGVLERLTDGHTISASGSSEVLDLRLAQRG